MRTKKPRSTLNRKTLKRGNQLRILSSLDRTPFARIQRIDAILKGFAPHRVESEVAHK